MCKIDSLKLILFVDGPPFLVRILRRTSFICYICYSPQTINMYYVYLLLAEFDQMYTGFIMCKMVKIYKDDMTFLYYVNICGYIIVSLFLHAYLTTYKTAAISHALLIFIVKFV